MRPPGRRRASTIVTSWPAWASSYPATRPASPAPSTITFLVATLLSNDAQPCRLGAAKAARPRNSRRFIRLSSVWRQRQAELHAETAVAALQELCDRLDLEGRASRTGYAWTEEKWHYLFLEEAENEVRLQVDAIHAKRLRRRGSASVEVAVEGCDFLGALECR